MTQHKFQFVEGTSSKFWAVAVSDATLTVQFGKIGTAGQTQTKAFASPDKAQGRGRQIDRREHAERLQGGDIQPPGPTGREARPGRGPDANRRPVAAVGTAGRGPPSRRRPARPAAADSARPLDLPQLKEQFIASNR